MSILVCRGLSTLMYDTEGDRRRTLRNHIKQTERAVVPDDVGAINRWLRLRSRLGIESDPEFPIQVVYRRTPRDLTSKRVVLRVHGVYVDGQLNDFGDNGESASGCYRPLQWVWLTWGYDRFREQFERETEHLRMVMDACFEQLHVDPPPRDDSSNGLYLRRRVERVVCSAITIPALKIETLQDDLGHCAARSDDIRPGDLIEASVQIDIEIAIDPYSGVPCASVFFSFSKILRLCQRRVLSESGPCNLPLKTARQNHRTSANMGWGGGHTID